MHAIRIPLGTILPLCCSTNRREVGSRRTEVGRGWIEAVECGARYGRAGLGTRTLPKLLTGANASLVGRAGNASTGVVPWPVSSQHDLAANLVAYQRGNRKNNIRNNGLIPPRRN
jgi:hypothetical protein